MAVVFQFWGNQVGTVESVEDDGSGNTVFTIGEMPFLPTDRILITITNESFDADGEFLPQGEIIYTEVRVIRDGVTYNLSVDDGAKIKESGGGTNKEQGDTFFQTNDTIGPADSGPFAGIPEEQYVFAVGTTLSTDEPVVIPRQSGPDGNSNFDIENGMSNLICFARGSLIRTPQGDVPVETLARGDLVETRDDGPQPVRWVGRRRLSSVPARFRPVRIERDAFGPGRPFAPLDLSPQHRVLLDGARAELYFGEAEVLGPVKSLENGRTIRSFAPAGGIEYFHVCFDRHQIVQANGLACESFYPGPGAVSALEEATRRELLALFPDLAGIGSDSPIESARQCLRGYETELMARSMVAEAAL